MRAIIKAALAIDELAYDLENISADDGKQIGDYTDAEIVSEAKYVLDQFQEALGGHLNYEDLSGENGEERQEWARGEVRQLKALIKKFKA
jgi:hypothetical protein